MFPNGSGSPVGPQLFNPNVVWHKNIRVNAIRFSTYISSKAGNATLTQEDVDTANKMSPLQNARPEDLAYEVVHLFRPEVRITGEIRHVDGGYHITG